jgi:hypothetical protein
LHVILLGRQKSVVVLIEKKQDVDMLVVDVVFVGFTEQSVNIVLAFQAIIAGAEKQLPKKVKIFGLDAI